MARSFVAGNWKMNNTLDEATSLAQAVRDGMDSLSSLIEGVECVLCPPFTSLSCVSSLLEGTSIKVGAQNMHFEEKGAFTGEISSLMLRDMCQYVILGHSERRHIFGESDDLVSSKVSAALKHDIDPILCVGELLEERDTGNAQSVVKRQLLAGLSKMSSPHRVVVAYEPVWAIGTGRPATSEDAAEMMEYIRTLLIDKFGQDGHHTPLIYGGSVTASNILDFVEKSSIDGALVGGASLKSDEFIEIIRTTALHCAGQ